MSTFTPGPWDAGSRVIDIEGGDFTPIDAAEYTVAFVPAAREADAHLIAAAPDLYAIVDEWLTIGNDPKARKAIRERARAALFKIDRGEQ